MTETELAWLAGWLEGEGTFVVTSGAGGTAGKRYLRVRVNAVSTDEDTISYVQSIAGGVKNGPYHRSDENHKSYWTWTLSTHKTAVPLMKQLRPWMRSARRVAQIDKAILAAENYMALKQGTKGV